MGALNAMRPTKEPRATEYVPQMIAIMETLVAKGFAYAAEGHVLFNVPAMPDYGQLSRRSLDDMIAGARVEVAPYKKHPGGLRAVEAEHGGPAGLGQPWGRGRPGWHIECSAMSGALLGEVFDIHGGGIDLIFPHHENEIAQSRCAHGTAVMAKTWMHNGFVQVNGQKMSKSLGNYFTVHELLEEGHRGEAIRLALLSSHYRQPTDITRDGIKEAKAQLDRFYSALQKHADVDAKPEASSHLLAALADDLNTPLAISEMHELLSKLNKATQRSGDPRGQGGPARRRRPDGPVAAEPDGVAASDRRRRSRRDRAPDRSPQAGAQGQELRRSRPHPPGPGGQGHHPGRRPAGHKLEAGLRRRSGVGLSHPSPRGDDSAGWAILRPDRRFECASAKSARNARITNVGAPALRSTAWNCER